MILVLGHVARVHPTANSLLCAVCRYESGERTQLPCCPSSRINPGPSTSPRCRQPVKLAYFRVADGPLTGSKAHGHCRSRGLKQFESLDYVYNPII